MNFKLLLALIVLMEPLREILGDADSSVLKSARKRSRGGRRKAGGGGTSKAPSVIPGLGEVEAKTKDIISHTEKLLGVMSGNSKRQDFFLELCHKVRESQEVVRNTIGKVIKFASQAHNNTDKIKSNQEVLLSGQEDIQDRISDEHQQTRKRIAQAEKSLENDIEKVVRTQSDILGSLQKSEDSLAAGFDKIFAAERRLQGLNSQVIKAVEESAAANAQGQANITAELKDTRKLTLDGLDKAIDRQKVILDRIASAEKSQLAKLDKVRSNQVDILKLIKESQKVVVKSIHEAISIEGETQNLVKESTKSIQKELGEHKKDQGDTQHLAKKCLENTKCDLDKVHDLLGDLAKLVISSGNSVQKGLKEIRSRQSATQSKVQNAEKTIIKAANSGFSSINSAVGSLRDLIDNSGSRVKGIFNSIAKNIRDTRNSQESAGKLLDAIHHAIDKLDTKH